MKIISRNYQNNDYQRVRTLLIESYPLIDQPHNWGLDRWDVCRFCGHAQEEITGKRPWESDVHLWETESGKLVGVANAEDSNNYFFQIHPHYREIEPQMLAWTEAHHQTRKSKETPHSLHIFTFENDQLRNTLLQANDYTDEGACEYDRQRSLDAPIPKIVLPQGYHVRNIHIDDPSDCAKWATADNNAFGHQRNTAASIAVRAQAPTYREDLDLVAVAPDGSFAAFCIVWLAEENGYGVFEPVGTHPDHRRKGLASAVINAGLQRLKELGATLAYVGSGADAPSNYLYEALGFNDYTPWHHWKKEF